MVFSLDSSDFMQVNTENPKTPTKQHKTPKTTLPQLFMSSPDLLTSQLSMKLSQKTILKSKKRKTTASPMLEHLSSGNQDSQDNQSSDKLLQQVRKHLKQALQQFTNPTVQLELENSIKSLDQARFFANLDSLKQPEEGFHGKPGVQEQLDDFKKEVNSKLDQILCQTVQTAKKFTFQTTPTANSYKVATSNSKSAKSAVSHPEKPKSYAAALEKNLETSTWTTVQNTRSKPTATSWNTTSYRDRHLIITSTTVIKTLNSIFIRNNINNALKSANLNIMVVTVTMSQSKSNIVITTLSETTAEDLLKHQKIWQHVLDFTKVKKNEKWYKVVAHEISTAIFNIPNGMQLAKEEIETFNKDLKLACLSTWLTSEEIQSQKMHSSVILVFGSNQEVKKALRNRLIIAEVSVKTAVYNVSKSTDQCNKCQQFEHHFAKCQNAAKCQICVQNHNTRQHECYLCSQMKKRTICIHTVLKCSNCQKMHRANSSDCMTFKALQSIFSTTDHLVMKL